MSFQQRKLLADAKEIHRQLWQVRSQIKTNKKRLAISELKQDAGRFLTEQGFNVTRPTENQLAANYKGEMNIKLTFSNPDEAFIGADIIVDIDYLKLTFILRVNIKQQYFPSIDESQLEQAISQYEQQNSQLAALNGSDIQGLDLVLVKDKAKLDLQNVNSMSEALQILLDM